MSTTPNPTAPGATAQELRSVAQDFRTLEIDHRHNNDAEPARIALLAAQACERWAEQIEAEKIEHDRQCKAANVFFESLENEP